MGGESVMTPGEVLIWIVAAVVCGFIGHAIGKPKGRESTGAWLGALLGVIGIIIIALMGRDREAEIREAQRQLEIQAEAARRAGYAYPMPGALAV
jgi:uncharacterized membrane protein YeaQ/YmgE (transglycosylase-associated protein family)